MVARLNFLFMLAPDAMTVVATIGALTAFFAGTIAIVQPDIKKVLAYSTISQLGYMFLGVGVGAFAAGIFHVMTHAFFKGLLFLCAGSVIHALGGEQDMNKMGALRKHLPITFATMLIATLAIAAVPGFSGFFSKDLILERRVRVGAHVAVGARRSHRRHHRLLHVPADLHDVPRRVARRSRQAASPPRIAARDDDSAGRAWRLLSVIGGWVGLPKGLAVGRRVRAFPGPGGRQFQAAPSSASARSGSRPRRQLSRLLGILLAYICYLRMPGLPKIIAWRAKSLYDVLCEKYYVDELYNLIVTRPLFWVSNVILNRGSTASRSTARSTALASACGPEASLRGARKPATSSSTHSCMCSAWLASSPTTSTW